jgi:hypothetical protein
MSVRPDFAKRQESHTELRCTNGRAKILQGSDSVDGRQFTSLEGVDSIFRFSGPFRLNFVNSCFIEALPKQINQHCSFGGVELKDFLLSGCKAHEQISFWTDASVKKRTEVICLKQKQSGQARFECILRMTPGAACPLSGGAHLPE